MLLQLRRDFPDETANQTDSEVASLIQEGIRRGADYGIVNRQDVRRYLHLMLMIAPDFDSDPQLAWITPILNSTLPAKDKLERIFEYAHFGLSIRS